MVKKYNKKDIKLKLQELDRLLIIARYNHIFLYNREFWKKHIKCSLIIFRSNEYELKKLPFFIWLKLIPVIIVLWYAISFALLILLDLRETDRNMLFLVNYPHTILMLLFYHKLSNKILKKYSKKIKWNIKMLK